MTATKTLTKEEVEQQLQSKAGQIEQRLAALQEEVVTVGPSIKKAVFGHPLVSLGGALLAGLAVGLLFGGKKKRPKKAFGAGHSHKALVDHYVEAIMEEARHRVAGGEDVSQAVREALDERVPLIVYEVPEAQHRQGILRQVLGLVLRQVVPLGIQMGMDYLTPEMGEPRPGNPEQG
ncbi:MAG: hypothetical protein ACE5G0_10835 [Rhodothermales bacterium]